MGLIEDPEWQEYCIYCENENKKRSLVGFVRWSASRSNGTQNTIPKDNMLVVTS